MQKDLAAHTVTCYRNSTKCKICGEVISKATKKQHLARWRDVEKLRQAIKDDNEDLVSLHFDHGMDCNMQFLEDPDDTDNKARREEWTPMHYAAENGCMNLILALVSRGAGIDPTDQMLRTPLMVAIENSKSAVARSLIELGADIESTDVYGKTSLMYACKAACKEVVELLIKCKADIKAVNKLGDSAVTMA